MRTFTKKELADWKYGQWLTELCPKPIEIDGIHFGKYILSLGFAYKNSGGLIFPDNGYLGPQPDGKDYYPLVRLSWRFSNDSRFNPTVEPNIAFVVAAIKQSWNDFTK